MFYSDHVLNCLVKCVLYKHINRSRLYTAHNLRAFIKSRLQPSSYLYQFGIGFEFIPLNMLNSIFRQHLSTKNKDELRSWLKNHCTKMLKRCKNNLLHNTWRNTIIIKKTHVLTLYTDDTDTQSMYIYYHYHCHQILFGNILLLHVLPLVSNSIDQPDSPQTILCKHSNPRNMYGKLRFNIIFLSFPTQFWRICASSNLQQIQNCVTCTMYFTLL